MTEVDQLRGNTMRSLSSQNLFHRTASMCSQSSQSSQSSVSSSCSKSSLSIPSMSPRIDIPLSGRHGSNASTNGPMTLEDLERSLRSSPHAQSKSGDDSTKKLRSSFVKSVVSIFSKSKDAKNEQMASTGTSVGSLFDEEPEYFPKLSSPWGQQSYQCNWTELAATLFHRPVLDDIARVQKALVASEWSEERLSSLRRWLLQLEVRVNLVRRLKALLQEERSVVAGVDPKLSPSQLTKFTEVLESLTIDAFETQELYREAVGEALTSLVQSLNKDGSAMAEWTVFNMTEALEYQALSNMFHHMSDEEPAGVILVQIVKSLNDTESASLLNCCDMDIQLKLMEDWKQEHDRYRKLVDAMN